MASLQNRIIGAMTLQAATYEEVEADTGALGQAALIVVAASISASVSWALWGGLSNIIFGTVVAVCAWAISAVVIWLVGTKMLPGPNTKADIAQVMRTVGFAQSPGLLSFIAIIPFLGILISLAIWVWIIVASVIAVRQALDYDNDTMRAVIVCVIAVVIQWVVTATLVAMFGIGALMTGAIATQ